MNRKIKTCIGLGLVFVFFICGGPNCIPAGDNVTGGGGNYQPPPPPPNQPPSGGNNPPIIYDIHSDNNMIPPNGKVRLFVNASDPNGDPLYYHWFTMMQPQGFFANPGPDNKECDWIAPPQTSGPPSYELICEVKDSKGMMSKMSLWININYQGGMNYNKPPAITSVTASKQYNLNPNEKISFTTAAFDPDGTIINHQWSTFLPPAYAGYPIPIGIFIPGPNGPSVEWQAPLVQASAVGNAALITFNIEYRVTDDKGLFATYQLPVTVLTDTTSAP